MGLSEWSYGLVLGADGIGGAAGVLSTGFVLSRLGRRWAVGVNILGNALMFLTPVLTLNVWVTAASIAVGGIEAPLWGVVTRTLQQRIAPNELLGRVSSAYRFVSFGANAVGTLAGGLVASLWGTEAVFLSAGALTLLMLVPFQRSVVSDAIAAAEAAGTSKTAP
jgi:predicted MFS family arabinose efflux permease